MPENKRSDYTIKSWKQFQGYTPITSNSTTQQQQHQQQQSRPSSRHKRHVDAVAVTKPASIDRKPRKRRTLEKVGVIAVSVYFIIILVPFNYPLFLLLASSQFNIPVQFFGIC